VVIDGSKALAKAVGDVFGRFALVQRCQVHKTRNVLEQLPENKRGSVRKAMYDAYRSRSADTARRLLNNLERTLRKSHPGAAASLREGLDNTLTVLELGLGATLERSLSTTNAIENLNGNIRRITRRVKTWRDGAMILRWVGVAPEQKSPVLVGVLGGKLAELRDRSLLTSGFFGAFRRASSSHSTSPTSSGRAAASR
jgi:putative transposase